MNEAYWQGFIEKCAELGVDPEELLKQAQLGAALKGAVTSGAKGAWDVILRAIRKFGASAAGKGIGQFGRGVAAPYKALGRGLVGKGVTLGPASALGGSELAGRAVGVGGGAGLGSAGLLSLLGVARGAKMPGAGSPTEALRKLYESLRAKIS